MNARTTISNKDAVARTLKDPPEPLKKIDECPHSIKILIGGMIDNLAKDNK